MIRQNPCALVLLTVALLLSAAPAAHAAESYDNCTGFVTSIPAVITTQGTWCLKQDLATSASDPSYAAIEIQANNVVVDCNGFRLSDLGAGTATLAVGIHAENRLNETVRHCDVRGFLFGVDFVDTAGNSGGHLVEDSRFTGNTRIAVAVDGDGSIVRRNRVLNTGGSTVAFGPDDAYGIATGYSVDVRDNTVSGVTGWPFAYGIYTKSSSGTISGNHLHGPIKGGSGPGPMGAPAGAYGIYNYQSGRVVLRDNDLSDVAAYNTVGISCANSNGRAKNNVVLAFGVGMTGCSDDGDNVSGP